MHRYQEDADVKDLSEMEKIFMGIGGKEMTDLELLKREEQDILPQQIMRNNQQNNLQE